MLRSYCFLAEVTFKVPCRIYWNIRSMIVKFTHKKKKGNDCSSQNSSLKIKTGFFPCPEAMITSSLLIIFRISEIRVISFYVILCMYCGSSTETYYVSISVSIIFWLNFFPSNMLFSFDINMRKPKHVLYWETLCNKNIFVEFIMGFQISKHFVYNIQAWFKIFMTSMFQIFF